MAKRKVIGGPSRYYVDAAGSYRGEFRDAVDAETGAVVHSVALPEDLVEVAGPPPAPGKLWDGATWVDDASYQHPPPSLEERVAELEKTVGGPARVADRP